jgi:hypothetical protein
MLGLFRFCADAVEVVFLRGAAACSCARRSRPTVVSPLAAVRGAEGKDDSLVNNLRSALPR